MSAWVRLLAVVAAHPDRPYVATTIGRARGRSNVKTVRIHAVGGDPAERRAWALAELGALVDLYDRGMREPLPLYCLTSAAYAEAVRAGEDPVAAARREWTSDWKFAREDRDLEHALVLDGERTFAELLAPAPRPDEDWGAADPTRLGRYAHRLWDGLLACETVETR
jgi:exodeoxyribonuclease V gamma subunit